jgi:hypothetical protein
MWRCMCHRRHLAGFASHGQVQCLSWKPRSPDGPSSKEGRFHCRWVQSVEATSKPFETNGLYVVDCEAPLYATACVISSWRALSTLDLSTRRYRAHAQGGWHPGSTMPIFRSMLTIMVKIIASMMIRVLPGSAKVDALECEFGREHQSQPSRLTLYYNYEYIVGSGITRGNRHARLVARLDWRLD